MFSSILYNIVNKHLEDFAHFVSPGRVTPCPSLYERSLRCCGNAVDWSSDFEGPEQVI